MPPEKKPVPVLGEEGDAPKRFIRTFATDSAALKAGGKPDFTSAVEAPASKSAPLSGDEVDLTPGQSKSTMSAASSPSANRSSLIGPSTTAFAPTSATTPEKASSPAERLVTNSALPSAEFKPKPPAPPAAAPPPPQSDLTKTTPIHTYTSDFSTAMKTEKASTVSILAAEGDSSRVPPRFRPSVIHSDIPLIIGGVLLLVLGGVGTYGVYRYQSNEPLPVIIAPAASAPIFVDERAEIAGTGRTLRTALVASVAKPLPSGNVRLLYTSVATSTGNDVFRALQLAAPDVLLRNVNAEGSIAGVINAQGSQAPFFILSVASYSDTFAGMLAWEPRMASDMSELFPRRVVEAAPAPIVVATTTVATSTKKVASSTPIVQAPPVPIFENIFHDEVILNHDVRILRDLDEKSVIVYGYWNPTTLVIARDEAAFTELLERLATSRTQK